MRFSALSRSASLSFPDLTWRARLPLIVANPASMRSRDRSLRLTSKPATAQTWAMPFPICPAPITPTDLICIYVEYLLPKGLASLSRPFARGKCISHMQHGAKTGKSAVLEAALLLFSQLPELGLELGYGLEEIGDQTVIGDLEDRRFLILVDR